MTLDEDNRPSNLTPTPNHPIPSALLYSRPPGNHQPIEIPVLFSDTLISIVDDNFPPGGHISRTPPTPTFRRCRSR